MGGTGSKLPAVMAAAAASPDGKRRRLGATRHRVDRMTEAQLNEFRDAFNRFDRDRSGYIDASELQLLCEWVGQDTTDEEVAEMMSLADGDNSGKVDFFEFATLMAHKMGDANPDQTLHAAFSVFDGNGDGTISAEELRAVMREIGEPVGEDDIQNVLRGIDMNGDGKVDYGEFAKNVTREMREGGFALV